MQNPKFKDKVNFYAKRLKARAIQIFYHILSPDQITPGSYVKCIGQGYPHWKGRIFYVLQVKYKWLYLSNNTRVDKRDFYKIYISLLPLPEKCSICLFGPTKDVCSAPTKFKAVTGQDHTCDNGSLFTLKT